MYEEKTNCIISKVNIKRNKSRLEVETATREDLSCKVETTSIFKFIFDMLEEERSKENE